VVTTRRAGRLARAAEYLILLLACAFALVPILWGLSTSLKPTAEISRFPPTLIPQTLTLDNYVKGVFTAKFLRYMLNTVLVFGVSLAFCLILSSHAAYAAARSRFAGKNVMLMLMFATIMIPGVAIIVPLYLGSISVGLYDTIWILVLVYSAWLTPTLVWLLQGFVASVPVELEESARIDGCSRLTAFYRITFPLLRPGLLAGTVLVFANIWNEFLIGYCLILSDTNRLVQVGIYFFITEVGIDWGGLMAGAMWASVPIIVAYAFLQRAFVQGLSAGAVKG